MSANEGHKTEVHGSVVPSFASFLCLTYVLESPALVLGYEYLLQLGTPLAVGVEYLLVFLAAEALLILGLSTNVARTIWLTDEGILVELRSLNRVGPRLIRWSEMRRFDSTRLLPGSVILYPVQARDAVELSYPQAREVLLDSRCLIRSSTATWIRKRVRA